jgi:hypothetical protein
VIIAGHSGAGKTTLAGMLGMRTGFAVAELGHIVRAEARAHGVQPPLLYADSIFCQGAGTHFAAQLARRSPGGSLIIVGPRRPDEVDLIQHRLGRAVIVALRTPERVRAERRGRSEQISDDRWLERRDEIEVGWGLERLVSSADLLLDGTLPTQELADVLLHEWIRAGDLPRSYSHNYY